MFIKNSSVRKINILLTFISFFQFETMFCAEKNKEEYEIEIKFEKKDNLEKEPFTMFFENFCKTLNIKIDIENFKNSEYDFAFSFKDKEGDFISVFNNYGFKDFYNKDYWYEKKSTTRHLFFVKEPNKNIKVYDEIIKNEKLKNISITVYIEEDLKANNEEDKKEDKKEEENKENKEEEKKEEEKKENKENNEGNNVPYKHIKKNLNGNDDKNNNGNANCPCCNCC